MVWGRSVTFTFQRLKIPDVVLIEPKQLEDRRGRFMETYKQSVFIANGISDTFVQDNYSYSLRGTLRGLHYQLHPKAQAKLVMALRGEVFDVAVDLRQGSPTYGNWVGVTLSADTFHMLYIPRGFAHGFCVLSQAAEVVYKMTVEYSPERERGVLWNDPTIGIDWPTTEPILSEKDTVAPLLADAEVNYVYGS